jgi:CRP/FNR family nitrogen fixation transcriptional regulator
MHAQVVPIRRPAAGPAAPAAATRSYLAGDEIYGQEDDATHVFVVVSGAVRTTRLSPDGRRQIAAFYYPGDVFGLETAAEHRYAAEALTPCEVLSVRRSVLHDGAQDPVLEKTLWDGALRELERTRDHLQLLGRKTACEKVAAFLVDLAGRFGQEVTELPMGRQDMADFLGLTIETVSRMITQLQAEGLVEFLGCRRFRLARPAGLQRLLAA